MSVPAANAPEDKNAEIDAWLQEMDTDPVLPVVLVNRYPSESNFATEAYLAVRDLQQAIRRVQGLRDYCNEASEIRARLARDGNDPTALDSRLNAHARRLDVELRALLALLFGSQLG